MIKNILYIYCNILENIKFFLKYDKNKLNKNNDK